MSQTALLILDVQNGILARASPSISYIPLLAQTVSRARTSGIKIIHVNVSFRPGHPEIHPRNKSFSRIAASNSFVEGSDSASVPAEITPIEGDIRMTKKRISAFCGTDLDVVLRGLGIETMVLAGISTSGAVLSTMREAYDRDFKIVVLRDLCMDFDEEVHRVVMEKIFENHAEVVESEEWLRGLAA